MPALSDLFVAQRALAEVHEHDWQGAHVSVRVVWAYLGAGDVSRSGRPWRSDDIGAPAFRGGRAGARRMAGAVRLAIPELPVRIGARAATRRRSVFLTPSTSPASGRSDNHCRNARRICSENGTPKCSRSRIIASNVSVSGRKVRIFSRGVFIRSI